MAQAITKTLKIVVIGGNGTIGKYVVKSLKEGHKTTDVRLEILIGGRQKKGNDIEVDISDTKSVAHFFEHNKKIDHLILCCGDGIFGPLSKMTKEQYTTGFQSKGFGQIDVVLQAVKNDSINDNGSITLTSGFLDRFPAPLVHGLSAINGCLHGFVRSAATEMPRGIRLNIVSPGLLTDSVPMFGPVLRGLKPVDGPDVALGYVRSVYGGLNGKIFEVTGAPTAEKK